MCLEFLYPEAKKKAITFSYDDGQVYDERLIDIFNKYHMKATFHLNSGTLNKEGYVKSNALKELYKGHEVACHGKNHKYLGQLTKEQLINEIWEDRKNLEGYIEQPVVGMSYAFGEYSMGIKQTLAQLGIKYSRTVESTQGFGIPGDFMCWHPTCHHNDSIMEKADVFLNMPEYMKIPLFYIWGHSFEFARENNWHVIEKFCEKVSFKEDVWYATNLEIEHYINAMRHVTVSTDEKMYINNADISIWAEYEGQVIELKPGYTKL